MASYIALAGVAAAAGLALRSLWKGHKSGKSCSCGGDCTHCDHCG